MIDDRTFVWAMVRSHRMMFVHGYTTFRHVVPDEYRNARGDLHAALHGDWTYVGASTMRMMGADQYEPGR